MRALSERAYALCYMLSLWFRFEYAGFEHLLQVYCFLINATDVVKFVLKSVCLCGEVLAVLCACRCS